MFGFPEYTYTRNPYNSRMRPSRSSYYSDPFSFYDHNEILRARQQQQELERRKRMQRQQQLLAERQRQIEIEEEMERQLQREQEERKRRVDSSSSACPFPPGTIIRGRDGRLYRVVGAPSAKEEPRSFEKREVDDSDAASVSALFSDVNDEASCSSDSAMEEVNDNYGDETTDLQSKMKSKEKVHVVNIAPKNAVNAISAEKENVNPVTNATNNKQKKTITLVVEDVPIEEDEELRDLHSVWRNRAPSPGEWMEPIENFDRRWSDAR